MQVQNVDDIYSSPVFIPKRIQMRSKPTFVTNRIRRENSLIGSVFPNSFKSTVTPLTIPVKAEVHQISDIRPFDESNSVNEFIKMTAIKSILKSKTESIANGGNGANKPNQFETINYNNLENKIQSHEIANMKSTGRKSSIVQFDIKDTNKAQLNANPRVLSSTSNTNSTTSLSTVHQSISSNQKTAYDLPKPSQRISDLRRILNPEIEKEDSLKKVGESIIHCECFELNLNNAAKIITVLVLLATLILVIRALTKLI